MAINKNILINRAIELAQDAAKQVGFSVMKASRHDLEWELNAALLAEAATAEREKRGLKGKSATGIIFSFNRPVQLHLLLASYFMRTKNPSPLVVQYGAKGEAFEAAYRDVARIFPQVTFVREAKFRDTLLNVLGKVTNSRVFFLVDDIVFTRDIDMAAFASLNPLETVPCLRLAPTLRYCYTVGVKQMPPSFEPFEARDDMLAFEWGEEGNEWNYPMSVDGNLFDTAEITVMSRLLAYKAPNTYEGALMRFAPVFRKRAGVCFAQPKIMNVPCNKVQDEVANKAGDVTPEFLLEQWNAGYAIDPLPFADYPNSGPHEEVALSFMVRESGKAQATAAAARMPKKAKAQPPAKKRKAA